MDLHEIEAKADELAEKMLATEHRQERTHHMWALEGLQRLAQIKATVAFSKEREQATTAPAATDRCGVWGSGGYDALVCTKGSPHGGAHFDENVQTYFQATELSADPTKPAADRLHELVSYFVQQSEEAATVHQRVSGVPRRHAHTAAAAASRAYDDAATKLQEILQEGGI